MTEIQDWITSDLSRSKPEQSPKPESELGLGARRSWIFDPNGLLYPSGYEEEEEEEELKRWFVG